MYEDSFWEDNWGWFALGFVVLALLAFIVLNLVGIHINTGTGQHTGYVTTIEQEGVFFKTWTAYVKTDTTSSQEDAYCVIDPNVVAQLTADVDAQAHVTVHYFSWLSAGIANCSYEGAIISSVDSVK